MTETHTPARDKRYMTALGRSIEDERFAVIDREIGPHDFARCPELAP
jgi:hypothetical protein